MSHRYCLRSNNSNEIVIRDSIDVTTVSDNNNIEYRKASIKELGDDILDKLEKKTDDLRTARKHVINVYELLTNSVNQMNIITNKTIDNYIISIWSLNIIALIILYNF